MRWLSFSFPSRYGVTAALLLVGANAADLRPTVGPGATKEEAINAYGWPTGQSQAGTKEILSYPQGKITLENGRVERVDFSTTLPWPAPRARPAAATSSTAKAKPDAPLDFWLTNFAEAAADAKRRRVRILALFTGSDWSPASRQFQDEVEFQTDFVNTVTGDFALLRLDFPTRTAQPPELRQQNGELRARYGVTTYPSLLVLDAEGKLVAQVDLGKIRDGEPYRAQVMAALRDVKNLLGSAPRAPSPDLTPAAAPARDPTAPPGRLDEIKQSLTNAGSLLTLGIIGGLVLAGIMLWLLWRNRPARPSGPRAPMASRIGDAASGLPSGAELRQWPVEKVRTLAAALAEAENYVVAVRAGGSDPDLALVRRGESQPRVLVACAAGGPIGPKRMRELVGALAVENVAMGWFVSPGGFSAEARSYAKQNNIQMIDVDALLSLLRDLPPLALPKVIARINAPPSAKPA